MVIDISGSTEEEYRMNIRFVRSVAYGLDIDHDQARVGAVAYSGQNLGEFFLTSYVGNREGVVTALSFYNFGGTTNTAAALDNVRTNHLTVSNGKRSGVDTVVILLTDGYSNVNADQTVLSAERLRLTGAKLYGVATGDSPNRKEVEECASSPSSKYVLDLPNDSAIDTVSAKILDDICSN
jgi:collagen type VI alpha